MSSPTATSSQVLALTAVPTPRSSAMLLMNEELARARIDALYVEAQAEHRARRLIAAQRAERRAMAAARRWTRRVEAANRRARLAREAIR